VVVDGGQGLAECGRRLRLDGGEGSEQAVGPTPCGADPVTITSSNLYWADQGDGTIWEANLDGSNSHPLTLIAFQNGPFGVAVGPQ
jgi:hypothetical protein